jgi:hypothetical protein
VPPLPPALIVVNGNMVITAPVRVAGLLYSHADIAINAAASVRGAVIAAGDITITGAPTIVYDPAVLKLLNLNTGSFVRVPGSWRDFQ